MSGFWLQVYLAVINSNKISPPMASSCLQSIECIVSKTCSFFKYCNNPRNIKFEWTTFPVVFFETKYSRVDQTKFVEDSPKKLEVILCLNKPYHLEFFKRLPSTNFTWSTLEYFVSFYPADAKFWICRQGKI